ncbi:MAG: M48 family metallopeptidase [Methanothrix sp.]|nr:M48 family metallopeptidase [Methanothrix sp.]MCX8207930.1 M48 family metallopeptidase [Methanothrix sp.]
MRIERADEWKPLAESVPANVFRAEVHAWAERIGVEPREIRIRPMKHKWGSCSSAGRLTFNVELLRQPSEIRRRVIVEELLHLRVPNHGALFRALLSAYLEMY